MYTMLTVVQHRRGLANVYNGRFVPVLRKEHYVAVEVNGSEIKVPR